MYLHTMYWNYVRFYIKCYISYVGCYRIYRILIYGSFHGWKANPNTTNGYRNSFVKKFFKNDDSY